MRLTYCPEDYAAAAVRAMADASGGAVVARPAWPAADALVKSAWGGCGPPEGAPPPMAVVFVDMEPTAHAAATAARPILSAVHTVGGAGSAAARAAPPTAGATPASVVHVPYAFFSFGERPGGVRPAALLRDGGWDARAVAASKRRFAAWASRHCTRPGADGAPVETARVRFFDALTAAYKRVDALGGCRRNAEPPAGTPPPELDNDRGLTVWWYRAYKFSFAMENEAVAGYVSEKVVNSYLAHTVPIYWGAPDFGDYLNADAVVDCQPGPAGDFAACVAEVRRLDSDAEAYVAKLSQPLFKGNVVPDWMTWPYHAQHLREALQLD